jgi:hypothetical protein
MSKINQIKIPVEIAVEPKYELTRLDDGLIRKGYTLDFIEWKEDGTFKTRHSEPQVGLSCILDGNSPFYTWMTTTITELIVNEENFIKFKTQNSNYELHKLV